MVGVIESIDHRMLIDEKGMAYPEGSSGEFDGDVGVQIGSVTSIGPDYFIVLGANQDWEKVLH